MTSTEPRSAPRLRTQAALAAAVAVVVVAGAVAGNLVSRPGPRASELAGAADVVALYHGIEQKGTALGRPGAPLTLAIYVDVQCPYCGAWDREVLPTIVDKYIRTGKLRAEFRGLAFLGADSEVGLRTLLAAGEQNRLFEAQTLLFANQGTENSGWISSTLLDSLAASLPGVDTAKLNAAVGSAAVDTAIRTAAAQGQADGVTGTPTLLVGPTGGTLRRIELHSLDPAGTTPAIDQALAELAP